MVKLNALFSILFSNAKSNMSHRIKSPVSGLRTNPVLWIVYDGRRGSAVGYGELVPFLTHVATLLIRVQELTALIMPGC